MFSYKEAIEEQKRMIEFRDKHYYTANPQKEEKTDKTYSSNPSDTQEESIYLEP